MHKPTCNIRRLCGDRESRYRNVASPDNPYLGGDYRDNNDSSFDPESIPNLLQWVSADALEGVVDGDPVVTWPDRTVNGNDFTQGTAAKWATYKTNILNGKPVVRFDNTNDGYVSALNVTPPFSIFIVYSYRSAVSASRRAFVGTALNWLIGPYGNFHQLYHGTGFIQGPAVVQNEFVLAHAQQVNSPSNNVAFYVNNTLIGSANPGTEPDNTGLGASNPFGEPLNGDVAEVLVYGTELTSVQRDAVATYLNNKYSIY